jgi:hypothetical protein
VAREIRRIRGWRERWREGERRGRGGAGRGREGSEGKERGGVFLHRCSSCKGSITSQTKLLLGTRKGGERGGIKKVFVLTKL